MVRVKPVSNGSDAEARIVQESGRDHPPGRENRLSTRGSVTGRKKQRFAKPSCWARGRAVQLHTMLSALCVSTASGQ